MQTANFVPIYEKDLGKWVKPAMRLLKSVTWKDERKRRTSDNPGAVAISLAGIEGSASEDVSILEIAKEESYDEDMLSNPINNAVHALRTGLTIALHVEDLYKKATGLDLLLKRNRSASERLPPTEQAELHGKLTTAAAIALYALASYVAWNLSSEDVSDIDMAAPDEPLAHFTNPTEALTSVLFYYGKDLNRPGVVNDSVQYVKFTLMYFRKVIDAVKLREKKLAHTEPFVQTKYKLDGYEFVIDGFELLADRSVFSASINPCSYEEIVGNDEAKHLSQRMWQRLLCYNFAEKKNPMLELGALPKVRLMEGRPGTGKTMMLRANATEVRDRCVVLKRPPLLWPFPDNIISTYQGGSAERAMEWVRPLNDPTKIIYAWIDDAEGVLEDPSRPNISAGVKEVRGVLLRHLEGVSSSQYGNVVIDVATNYPEMLDAAFRSRIVARFSVDGATTVAHYLDQDYRWYRKYGKLDASFVNMKDPKGHVFLKAQQQLKSLSDLGTRYLDSQEARIKKYVDRVRADYDINGHDFFAVLYSNICKVTPFSSRDLRNIQAAVDGRILDFDMPIEWFDDPTVFLDGPYDKMMGMITELMKANMRGLSFAEIRLEE